MALAPGDASGAEQVGAPTKFFTEPISNGVSDFGRRDESRTTLFAVASGRDERKSLLPLRSDVHDDFAKGCFRIGDDVIEKTNAETLCSDTCAPPNGT